MIKWIETKDVTLFFNANPTIQIREVLPTMTSLKKKDTLEYPFMLMKKLDVEVYYHKKGLKFSFSIPKGVSWNGSDIPRFLWALVGSRDDPQFLVASCLHDFVCLRHYVLKNNRRLSSEMFRVCLLEANVPRLKARVMSECVDLWQRLCHWN